MFESMPVEHRPAADDHAPANHRATEADADKVPIPGNPHAAIPVTAHPNVSGAGARRNVGDRRADINSDASCLGGCCAHTQSPCQHRYSQHELLHERHKSSSPGGPYLSDPPAPLT